MTNWYAVYTRPRCEMKVAENFARRKWEAYCPLSKVSRQWIGKVVQIPLFRSYVFVRLEETQLAEVKSIDGVINIVCWLGKPAVIRDIEVDMMRRFLSVHKEVQLEKTTVNLKEMVKLVNGPVMEKEGDLVSLRPHKVKLYLPTLGYFIVAEVEKETIEILVPNATRQSNVSLQ